MKCPLHGDELREEHNKSDEGPTAICLKCPRRYVLCYAGHYMEHCDLERGHDVLRPIALGSVVCYARGAKSMLHGHVGTVVSERAADGIVLVRFASGVSPCWDKNLEPVTTKHRSERGTEWEDKNNAQ